MIYRNLSNMASKTPTPSTSSTGEMDALNTAFKLSPQKRAAQQTLGFEQEEANVHTLGRSELCSGRLEASVFGHLRRQVAILSAYAFKASVCIKRWPSQRRVSFSIPLAYVQAVADSERVRDLVSKQYTINRRVPKSIEIGRYVTRRTTIGMFWPGLGILTNELCFGRCKACNRTSH